MVIEAVLKEMGSIGFQWMEIHRTKASLMQQLDLHMNFSLNESIGFGLTSSSVVECEYKCPELDACIDEKLWCDGKYKFWSLSSPLVGSI